MVSPSYPDLVLASRSPRRQQMLRDLGLNFRLHAPDIDERYPSQLEADQVPAWLASKKALKTQKSFPQSLIIAADTLVMIDEDILGKPRDLEEARSMLERISGNTHRVVTGVQILGPRGSCRFSQTTVVRFRPLDAAQIQYYLDHYRPLDKAGAYGIQEWIGLVGIEEIQGDYYNVMGLPVGMLWVQLQALGYYPAAPAHRP